MQTIPLTTMARHALTLIGALVVLLFALEIFLGVSLVTFDSVASLIEDSIDTACDFIAEALDA